MVNSRNSKFKRNTVTQLARPSVLLSKIARPQVPDTLLARDPLSNPFTQKKKPRIVVLEAAPGYGKTCTAARWLSECALPNCWLTLDSRDNHEHLFWHYIVSACNEILPSLEVSDVPENINEFFLTRLINALTTAVQSDARHGAALVIDNFQTITDTDLIQSFEFLLTHLPTGLTVVALSRRPVPVPRRTRMIASGELIAVNAQQLSFDSKEAREFLELHGTEPAALDAILSDSILQAWPMGLCLAALCHGDNVNEQRQLAAEHLIHDYLIEEAFLSQPEFIRDILGKTVCIESLSPFLLDRLLEQYDGLAAIELLKAHGVYLEPLQARDHYRIHPIFRTAIQEHLRKTRGKSYRKHCEKAADQLEKLGCIAEAVTLWADLEQWERTTSLIFAGSAQQISRNDYQTLHDWLSKLPRRWIERCPRTLYLSVLTATHLQNVDIKKQLATLNEAEKILLTAIEAHRDQRVKVLSLLAFDTEDQAVTLLEKVRKLRTELEQREGRRVLIEPLSAREIEILKLIADGLRNKDIADTLSIALSTVKAHIYNIFSKLQSRSRTEAVSQGRELGLL